MRLADLSHFITQAAAEKVIGIKLIASSLIFHLLLSILNRW
jgi:hypothetical protein